MSSNELSIKNMKVYLWCAARCRLGVCMEGYEHMNVVYNTSFDLKMAREFRDTVTPVTTSEGK